MASVHAKHMCRGRAKAYFTLEVWDVPDDVVLGFSAHLKDGEEVPVMVFPGSGLSMVVGTTSSRELVVVLPMLAVPILFAVHGFAPNGDQVLEEVLTIDPLALKWRSRLNGKLEAAEVESLRDCDEQRLLDRVVIQLHDCMCDGEPHGLLRGTAFIPDELGTQGFQIRCYDEHFQEVGKGVRFLPAKVAKEHKSMTAPLTVRDFSVDVPLECESIVFVPYDGEGTMLPGFQTTDPAQLQELIGYLSYTFGRAVGEPEYQDWWNQTKPTLSELELQSRHRFDYEPTFSIIVPLYKTPIPLFWEMVRSVFAQSYGRWELLLVNASPEDAELAQAVAQAAEEDSRVVVVTLDENRGIMLNTNEGIVRATGDFVSFFDHDDLLAPNILFEYTKALNEHPDIDLLYCDEDKIEMDGRHVDPYFKPDFTIDYLRSNNVVCHMLTIRASVLEQLPLQTSEYDGSQDHNMTLMASEVARRIHHVPKVLYHWRKMPGSTAASTDSKPYTAEAGKRAIRDHLDRLGIQGTVVDAKRPNTYHVEYAVQGEPLVSIIIPTRDHIDALQACLTSIEELTTYKNIEIVLVENNSEEPATFQYYRELEVSGRPIRVVSWEGEGFNYSKLINFGVSQAKGDYLLLLNNDIEVITPGWIESMLGICQREDVGAVGVTLYYPDDTVQHAGIVIGADGPAQMYTGMPRWTVEYYPMRNWSAVTAACMMTKRSVFDEVGGFDEEFSVAFNDVDYCLKLRAADKLIVYTPFVELYHWESYSRGYDDQDASKHPRLFVEGAKLKERWPEIFALGDPYHNPNLTRLAPYISYNCLKRPGALF